MPVDVAPATATNSARFWLAKFTTMAQYATFSKIEPPPAPLILPPVSFHIDFPTETNRIYRLEASCDMVNWELRPPEIDGTGDTEVFFDASNTVASYRVVSREGVLPP